MSDITWGRGWGGTFIVWDAFAVATVPTFGPPFLDHQTPLLTTLGATSLIETTLSLSTPVSSHIEVQGLMRSSRIDRSLT